MKLTEAEIIALLDLHAGNIVDLACEGLVGEIYRTIERIRELVAELPQPDDSAPETRTMQ